MVPKITPIERKLGTKSFPLIECFIYALFTSINVNEALVRLKHNSYIYALFGFNTFYKYKLIDVLSCDEDEFKLSVQNSNDDVEIFIKKNKKLFSNIKQLFVTSGKNGCHSLVKNKYDFVKSFKVNNLIDTIGSGDIFYTYIIILTLIKKLKVDERILLSHLAASHHSKVFGNSKIISRIEYLKSIKALIA